ncbi:MAG: hypothetical protein FH756_10840 [Firmicutes bacterium]|nr:hypothetical protein [Bacillota bacterium]
MKRIMLLSLCAVIIAFQFSLPAFAGVAYDVYPFRTQNQTIIAPPGTKILGVKSFGGSHNSGITGYVEGYTESGYVLYATYEWIGVDVIRLYNGAKINYDVSIEFPQAVSQIKVYSINNGLVSGEIWLERTTASLSDLDSVKSSADAAKTSADAAHTDAQNAANRTWYNGNESAYWAYHGYANANSANSNSAAAHTDAQAARNLLNGSANSGKSLASTYDKANAANLNSWWAKSYLDGTQNGGKSLGATYDKANASNANASNAANRTWDSTEGKSVTTIAKETRNKADTNYNELVALAGDVNTLNTNVTNIESSLSGDTTPPVIQKIKGHNGATCTTNSTFSIDVTATDNKINPPEFRAKADTGSWSSWTQTYNTLTIGGITGNGAHTIEVEVRDAAGNVARDSITIFKV